MAEPQVAEPQIDEAAWEAWVAYRKAIRKPLREASWGLARKKMAVFGDKQMEAVEHSIANGWIGLYCPKDLMQPVMHKRQGWT